MKKLLIILLCCLVLAGCGSNSRKETSSSGTDINSESLAQQTDFEIDREKLESEGYEDIAGIAYAKIEDNEGEPVVYLVCHKNQPEQNIYLWSQITSNIEHISNYSITWNSKEYFLDMESKNVKTEEDMFALLPPDWEEALKTMLTKGDGAAGIVSKSDADDIDRAVENFAKSYLDNIDNAKEEEPNIDVLMQKEYKVDGEEVSISLTKKEDKLSILVSGHAKNEEKASIMLATFTSQLKKISIDSFDISVFCKKLNVTYMTTDDGYYIVGTNKDGTYAFSAPDWLVTDFTMSEEKLEAYSGKIIKVLNKFAEDMENKISH